MIKFAALTPNLSQPGGAERTVLIQLRYSDPTRMQCTGIALSGYGGLDLDLGSQLRKYTTIHGDMPRGKHQRPRSAMVQTTYRNLNEAVVAVCKEADVLVTWGSLALGQFTAGLEIPVVCVSHVSHAVRNTLVPVSGITHLVAVSQNARTFFSATPGVSDLPIANIPNGVEVDRICPRRGRAWQRAQWGVGSSEKVLLYLGRQVLDKNPWASIKAVAKLPDEYKLIMIGNQPYKPDSPRADLVSIVNEYGLHDRVKFLPPTPDIGDILAGADCMLHLSLCEADSLVVKEAFIAGLPVVHTQVGSIPEMEAEFGQVGWSVPFVGLPIRPDAVDSDMAAEQVCRAVAGRGSPIVNKMRAIAWERWTGPAMCERWADYLDGVVAEWPARRARDAEA